MNLTMQHLSYLTGIHIDTILRGTYQPAQLSKMFMMDYVGAHFNEWQTDDAAIRAFNLVDAFSKAEHRATEHRTFNLPVPHKWMDGLYGIYETPTSLRLYADKPNAECIHFTYDVEARDFGEKIHIVK